MPAIHYLSEKPRLIAFVHNLPTLVQMDGPAIRGKRAQLLGQSRPQPTAIKASFLITIKSVLMFCVKPSVSIKAVSFCVEYGAVKIPISQF